MPAVLSRLHALLTQLAPAPAALETAKQPSTPPPSPSAAAVHPTSPLTAPEIELAVGAIKAHAPLDGHLRFENIMLEEPCKRALRAGEPVRRAARVNYFRSTPWGEKGWAAGFEPGVYIAVVELPTGLVTQSTFLPDAFPMRQPGNWMASMSMLAKNPELVAALARRQITDLKKVHMEPWPTGPTGKTFRDAPYDYAELEPASVKELGKFSAYVHMWYRHDELDNCYAHPIDGLKVVVDCGSLEVIEIEDQDDTIPIPMEENNYVHQRLPAENPKHAPRPIQITQPEGATFAVDGGNKLSWMGWDMVVGFNAREGLTLHQVGFTEPGTAERRPICYRASVAEMVVPYGSPNRGLWRKSVFDTGEAGFGKAVNELELGCDCLGNIAYLDVFMNNDEGAVEHRKNAICIHEEDDGVLWKHKGSKTGKYADQTDMRRGTKLVVSSMSTIGNYEYGYYWYISLDGSIELEVKATGIISTSACIPGQPEKYEVEVSRGVAAVTHQHTFCARLDMELDGGPNTVLECDTVVPDYDGPGGENPYGNACYITETPVAVEGPRAINRDAERYWKVVNPSALNALGQPTGYELKPTDYHRPILHPEGLSGQRAQFIYAPLWVTPKAADGSDFWPSGDFMNCNGGGEGLPAWVAQKRPVEGEDVVLWHSFGLHHNARPEDFPIQNVVKCGFKMMPFGFFTRNPAIDMAQTGAGHCHAPPPPVGPGVAGGGGGGGP